MLLLGVLMLSGATSLYLPLLLVALVAVALLAAGLFAWVSGGALAEALSGGPAATGAEGMIGAVGVVRIPVGANLPGWVFVRGERWRAVPALPPEEAHDERDRGDRDRVIIGVGSKVRVVEVRGGEVVVAPVGSDELDHSLGSKDTEEAWRWG